MIKRLAACIREYRRDTILTPLLMIGEVVCECIIPLYTAQLDQQSKPDAAATSFFTTASACWCWPFCPSASAWLPAGSAPPHRRALQKISGMICFTAYRAFPSQTSTNFRRPLSSRA